MIALTLLYFNNIEKTQINKYYLINGFSLKIRKAIILKKVDPVGPPILLFRLLIWNLPADQNRTKRKQTHDPKKDMQRLE